MHIPAFCGKRAPRIFVAALAAVFACSAFGSAAIAQTQPGNGSGGPIPPANAAGEIAGGSQTNTGNGGWEPVANGPNCQGLTLAAVTFNTQESCNMTLVQHMDLHGQTAGEAFAMIIASGCTGPLNVNHQHTCANGGANGDRFMYVANEGTPDPIGCFQIFDVQPLPAAPIHITAVAGQAGIPEQVGGYGNPHASGAPCTTTSCTGQVTSLRCNNLDSARNQAYPNGILAVAQEATQGGAGILLYDIGDPSNPKFLSYFNSAGTGSHGTHHLWFFNNGNDVEMAGGAGHAGSATTDSFAGLSTVNAGPGCPGGHATAQFLNLPAYTAKRASQDHQFPMIVDVSSPLCPREVARWYFPGTSVLDPLGIPGQMGGNDQGVRQHDGVIQPTDPKTAYLAMLDGGILIMSLSDVLNGPPPHGDKDRLDTATGGAGACNLGTATGPFSYPAGSSTMCSNVWSPLSILAYRGTGFTHTVKPVESRGLLLDSEEALSNNCADGPHRLSLWQFGDPKGGGNGLQPPPDEHSKHVPQLLSVAPFAWDTGTEPSFGSLAGLLPKSGTGLCGQIANPGGRMTSHQPNRDQPNGPSWHNDNLVLNAEFRGGVRLFNFTNPYQMWEMGYFIPGYNSMGGLSTNGSEQINDVYVDDRAFIYINDRFGDGVWVLTSPFVNCARPAICHT